MFKKLKELIGIKTFKIQKTCFYCEHSKRVEYLGGNYTCKYIGAVHQNGCCWLFKDKWSR